MNPGLDTLSAQNLGVIAHLTVDSAWAASGHLKLIGLQGTAGTQQYGWKQR